MKIKNFHPLNRTEKKLKLCIIIPGHWSRIMGGAQYQVKCLIEELNKLNRFEIFNISRDCDSNYKPVCYQLIRLKYPGVYKRGLHRHLIEMVVLQKLLKSIKPHIIYQRVGCAQTGIAARYAKISGCKLFWHVSSENDLCPIRISFSKWIFERILDKIMLNYGINNTTEIIVQTYDQKKLLEKRFKRAPLAVIRNYHPLPQEIIDKKKPIKIIWLSNLKDLKQPEIFIKLSEEFRNSEKVQFYMVGGIQGGDHQKNKYIEKIKTSKNLNYLGLKNQEEVNALLAKAHILVNTSRYEGFPNTFIQAWMRQMPVISLNVDPDQLIKNQGLGMVSGTYSKLKADVTTLVENESLRMDIGRVAEKFALKNFTNKNAEKIIDLFCK